MKVCTYLIFLTLIINSCTTPNSSDQQQLISEPIDGLWLGKLEIKTGKFLPFNFEILQDSVFFFNGQEKISSSLKKLSDSTFSIEMPVFNSRFFISQQESILKGEWINLDKGDNYRIPFKAAKNLQKSARFSSCANPTSTIGNVDGRWEVTFGDQEASQYKAIGVFNQMTNNLTGTFLTETGDYRFLQGNVTADSFYLSCFDGSHAFLFEAAIDSNQLKGSFYSGTHFQQPWKAKRNQNFKLTHPDSITTIDKQFPISFSLADLDSNVVRFPSKRFSNKVLIIQIIGSWCPNCLDETAFFNTMYNSFHDQGLEIVSIAFEKPDLFKDKVAMVRKLKTHFNAKYPFLIGGSASKKEVERKLPFLQNVASFPTTIYIDKSGKVRKVYSGFYGPGTGSFHNDFSKETSTLIQQLLNENLVY